MQSLHSSSYYFIFICGIFLRWCKKLKKNAELPVLKLPVLELPLLKLPVLELSQLEWVGVKKAQRHFSSE